MASRYGRRFRGWLSPPLAARLRGRVFPWLLAAALTFNPPLPGISPAPSSLEYEVKAAFLLNFTRFVEWPSTAFSAPEAPLTICIGGDDPFGRAIDQIVEGEMVSGRRVAVERIRPDQQKSCQVLYIGTGRNLATMLASAGPAVLTVGEGADFIHQGGIIAFVVDNRRVRFDINFKAAAGAGLKLSSKLLSVARSVER